MAMDLSSIDLYHYLFDAYMISITQDMNRPQLCAERLIAHEDYLYPFLLANKIVIAEPLLKQVCYGPRNNQDPDTYKSNRSKACQPLEEWQASSLPTYDRISCRKFKLSTDLKRQVLNRIRFLPKILEQMLR